MGRALLAWALVLSALVVFGPARAGAAPTPPRPVPPPLTVQITDAGFEPAAPIVAPGQVITFVNGSTTSQDVTAPDGAFASGPVPVGAAYTMSLPVPGIFPFSS